MDGEQNHRWASNSLTMVTLKYYPFKKDCTGGQANPDAFLAHVCIVVTIVYIKPECSIEAETCDKLLADKFVPGMVCEAQFTVSMQA